uniref:Transmembrane protein 50A n=1 Tax=Cryptomonas curvata TaxID=233186 RepID=A0A7S0N335_9CRYP|mmetsp:Transcript_6063/g.13432  ORF Transcript_6063/g.13432 Transcript_6063/m.13432 type:complete len:189 (+) Transcript_6063:117-683(+)
MALEGQKRLLAVFGGMIFGVGWLVFIDSIVVYNTCRQNLPEEDPCHWGIVQNKSLPPGSVQPPQPYGGWKAIDGQAALVYLPGALLLVSLFMINTVEARDLAGDKDWVAGGSPAAIKAWLLVGFGLGFAGLAVSVWAHAALFADKPDTKPGPGVGGITLAVLCMVSSLVLWAARGLGDSAREWGGIDL